MSDLSDFLGGSGGKPLLPCIPFPITTSKTIVMPADGVLVSRGIGAGGGGARRSTGTATGGYSGAWGCKVVRVVKGQSIAVVIGAAGLGATVDNTDGSAGGNTTITIAGVTHTAPGGLGGKQISTGVPTLAAPTSLPVDWDFGATGSRPGALSTYKTGGAGLDLFMQGGDATKSADEDRSGGGGVFGPGTGFNGGGSAAYGADILGFIPGSAVSGSYVLAPAGNWGVSFYGGSGGGFNGAGGNGGGGGGSGGTALKGGNGGGGGGSTSTSVAAGAGGYGGGGGGGVFAGGNGGPGYVYLELFVDSGV